MAGDGITCGQLLRQYRQVARLTQEDLAERSGYSANYLSKLERDERHLIDASMASGATHAFVDVDAVIEVNKIRELMHAEPLDRPARAEALTNRGQVITIPKNFSVAFHAGRGGRDAFER